MKTLKELKYFLILWITQSFSALGSAMTNFALVIWLYGESGSALTTALLSVCSYAPYVLMSIFAGALSDRWDKRKTMLWCDSFAAVCTVIVMALMLSGKLEVWHLYILNAVNGLMNTIQQPASDVATTLLAPPEHYQKISGMRSFSNSLVTILTPVLATSVMSFFGIFAVFAVDMVTFLAAFLSLLLFIKIPDTAGESEKKETVLSAAKSGLKYLKTNLGILWLILFLAAINLIASMYDAMLPALIIPRENGGESALGWVNTFVGIAMLAGSIVVTFMPEPKKPRKGDMQHAALFNEHGEFPAGIRADACGVVYRGGARVDTHTAYERLHGRYFPHKNTRGNAGQGIFGAKHLSVFYYPDRIFSGGISG